MHIPYSVLPGKLVRLVSRLRGGGGSALPGLFVEKIDPGFSRWVLSGLPYGVVLISGTNGKTTTTKMVVELFEAHGLRVFTNRTGSNFTRGIAAELIGAVNWRGKLSADIAVIELDEAYAVRFVRQVTPTSCLLLNVMRDQLDRFGEIDTTAGMLDIVAHATTEHIVINREDPRLLAIGQKLPADKVSYYGLQKNLLEHFPSDDELHGPTTKKTAKKPSASVLLEHFEGKKAEFRLGTKHTTVQMKLDGIYNVYNAAGATALVAAVLGKKLNETKLFTALSAVQPAFGRGEILTVKNQPLELVLVKNPSGFRLSLASYSPDGYATAIAINDNYADGRDMSWLWDVDFTSLQHSGIALTTGMRAYDMALRLAYDDVAVQDIESDIARAVQLLVHIDQPRRIYCTYTAMLAIRKELAKYTTVERVI